VSLLAGGIAGTAGKLATYPLDTVKKRLQVAGMARAPVYGAAIVPYAGTLDALRRIAAEEGVLRGWYKGTAPSLVKAGGGAALMFWSYDAAARALAASGAAWATDAGTRDRGPQRNA
jgi:hypothetical protein